MEDKTTPHLFDIREREDASRRGSPSSMIYQSPGVQSLNSITPLPQAWESRKVQIRGQSRAEADEQADCA